MRIQKLAFLMMIFTAMVAAPPAFAGSGPQSFSYEGRLYDDLGAPSAARISFKVQVLDQNEHCILYEESFPSKDLSATKGLFSLELGTGTPTSGLMTSLANALRNDVGNYTLNSCSYAVAASDGRKVRILANDGSGTDSLLTPSLVLGAAAYAMSANELEGKRASDFLLTDSSSNLTQTNLTSIFAGSGFSTLQDLINGKFLKSSSSGVQIPSFATDPSGPTPGAVWYDSTNNVLKYKNNSGVMNLGSGVTSITAGDGLAGGTITGSGTIALKPLGSGGNGAKVTYDVYGRVTAAAALAESDLPTISSPGKVSGNAISSGQIAGSTSISTSGDLKTAGDVASQRLALNEGGVGPRYVALTAPTLSASYTLTLPTAPGGSGQTLVTSGTGQLSWASLSTDVTGSAPLSSSSIWVGDGSNKAQAVSLSGDATLSNTGALTLATVPLSKGGTGLNALGTANQILSVNTGATGLEYRTLTAGAGISVTPGTGTLTIAATGAGGGVSSVGVSVPSFMTSSGGPITTSGTIALGFGAQAANLVFAGPTSATAAPGFRVLNSADIKSTVSGNFFGASGACSAGQMLTYSSVNDQITCAAYTLNASQVTTALGYTPVNKAGDTMTGNLVLPSNGLQVGTNDIVVSGGNVGVGTATPAWKLDVNGGFRASTMTANSTSVFSLDTTVYSPQSSSVNVPSAIQFNLTNYPTVDGSGSFQFFGPRNLAGNTQRNYIGTVSSPGASSYTAPLVIGQQTGVTSYAERMRLDTAGNLGIGTTQPNTGLRLDVQGGASASGAQGSAAGQGGEHRFYELAANGTDYVGFRAPDAVAAPKIWTLPAADGTSGQVLSTNGSGLLSWVTSGAGGSYLPLSGGTMSGAINMGGQTINGNLAASLNLTLDSTSNATKGNILLNPTGGNVGIGTSTPGAKLEVAGQVKITGGSPGSGKVLTSDVNGLASWQVPSAAGITTLNGLTGSTQSFAIGTSGIAPGFSSTGTTHTLNLPLASAASVTAGLLSKSDYDVFNGKQSAGNYITAMSGDVTTSVFTAGSVTATIANNAVTDAKIANVGIDKISSGSGKYLTYSPGGTSCTSGQTLKWNNTNTRWECGTDGGVTTETDPTVQAFAKVAPSADFTTVGGLLGLSTVGIAKGGTGLTTIGSANKILGVNSGATGLEYKTIQAGSNITITNAGDILTIAAAGGSGISNVTASSPLSVTNGSSTPALTISQASSSQNGYLNSSDWSTFNGKIGGTGATGYIPKFNGTASLTNSGIYDDGSRVGVKTAAPLATLDVYGSIHTGTAYDPAAGKALNNISVAGQGGYISWNQNGGEGRMNFINNRGGGSGGFDFSVYTGGGSYIGTPLMINERGLTIKSQNISGQFEGIEISGSGSTGLAINNTQICNASGCYGASDRRLKRSIEPLQNSLDQILQLQAVSYYWKDPAMPGRQIGFIAQEVETVFPEVVQTSPTNDRKTMNYGALVAPAVEAIKAIYQRLVALEDQFTTLSSQASVTNTDVQKLKDENAELRLQNTELKSKLEAQDVRLERLEKLIENRN